jgi:hypothetical protein
LIKNKINQNISHTKKNNNINEDKFDLFEDGTSEHEDNTTPISLLRRFLKDNQYLFYVHKKLIHHQYKLCKLEFTIENLNQKVLDFQSIFEWNRDTNLERFMFGLKKQKFMEIYNSDVDKFLIIKSLLIRIKFGYELIEVFNILNNERLIFASQLFIDTHIDFMNFIIENDVYDDSKLNNSDGQYTNDFDTPFKKYYPYDYRFVYCGDLPDLTTCIDLGNIWYDNKPKIKSVILYLIHVFASKTIKHKCSERNFLRILIEKYFVLCPILKDIYKFIICLSLLGNYPHATYRTEFTKRLQIVSLFHTNKNKLSDDIFYKWIVENDLLVVFITKEFHLYLVKSQYTLDIIMEDTKNWKETKMITIKAMNMIRSMISNIQFHNEIIDEHNSKYDLYYTIKESKSCFAIIRNQLGLLNQKVSILLNKLKKGNFLDFILFWINKFYEKNIVNKNSTVPIKNEDNIEKDIIYYIELTAFYVVHKYKDFIPTKFLKYFGVSENGFNKIRDFYFKYEKMEIPDNSIWCLLEDIYNFDKKDFFIIKLYFEHIKKNKSIKLYPFTQKHFENILYSSRIKNIIEPWNDLETTIDRNYFCLICKKWACPVVDPSISKSKVHIHSIGKQKALRDLYTNKLYCGKQVNSITIKTFIENNLYFHEGEISDQSVAKQIRNHKSSINCSTIPLMPINLSASIISIHGKKWALCEICCQPTIYEEAKFSTNGFTCCMHPFNPNISKAMTSNNQTKSDLLLDAKDELIRNRIKHGIIKEKSDIDYCVYCGNLCDDKNEKITLKIIDDIKKTYEIKISSLCNYDYDLIKNKSKIFSNFVIFKSDLFDQLRNSRLKAQTKSRVNKKASQKLQNR